jgi:hypothetical protein
LLTAILAILFAAGGFFGGVFYQKNKIKSVNGNVNGQFSENNQGPMGAGMNGQRPNMGTVTAVSSSSIKIKDTRSNSEKTYTITSSTKVSNNGDTVSADDIKVDDEVMIMADSSESSEAAQIILNPEQGGGFGPPSSNNNSSSINDSNIILD